MALLDSVARQAILVSEMTRVDVGADLTARHRAGAMTYLERDQAMSLLLYHDAYEESFYEGSALGLVALMMRHGFA